MWNWLGPDTDDLTLAPTGHLLDLMADAGLFDGPQESDEVDEDAGESDDDA